LKQSFIAVNTPQEGPSFAPAAYSELTAQILEIKGLESGHVGVFGFQGSGELVRANLVSRLPNAQIGAINFQSMALYERRYNGPEQTDYGHLFDSVIVAVPPQLNRITLRFIARQFFGAPLLLVSAASTPIGDCTVITYQDEALVRPKVGLVFPCAGCGRFNPQFMTLMQIFDIHYELAFREPYFDPRMIRSIRSNISDDSVFDPSGNTVQQSSIDKYYSDVLRYLPGLHKYAFIHHPVTVEALCGDDSMDFVVLIRDPRDVLNSMYHRLTRDTSEKEFTLIKEGTKEDGLNLLIDGFDYVRKDYFLKWPSIQKMARDFLAADRFPNAHTVRFEDVRYEPESTYQGLLSALKLDPRPFTLLTEEFMARAIHAGSFEAQTGGARREGEDALECYRFSDGRLTGARKGEKGDWKNHFPDSVRERIKSLVGEDLIALGYETDLNW
jgi:hypothetical protein